MWMAFSRVTPELLKTRKKSAKLLMTSCLRWREAARKWCSHVRSNSPRNSAWNSRCARPLRKSPGPLQGKKPPAWKTYWFAGSVWTRIRPSSASPECVINRELPPGSSRTSARRTSLSIWLCRMRRLTGRPTFRLRFTKTNWKTPGQSWCRCWAN